MAADLGGGGVRWWWPMRLSPLSLCGLRGWWHGGGGVRRRRAVGAAAAPAPTFISKNNFAESHCGLSADIHREGNPRLSAKGPSPSASHRERIAEIKLSVKAPPWVNHPSPR
jgi:hypothetical protein